MTAKLLQKKHLPLKFGKKKGKELLANFNGGRITSDAGIVWLAELDKKQEKWLLKLVMAVKG